MRAPAHIINSGQQLNYMRAPAQSWFHVEALGLIFAAMPGETRKSKLIGQAKFAARNTQDGLGFVDASCWFLLFPWILTGTAYSWRSCQAQMTEMMAMQQQQSKAPCLHWLWGMEASSLLSGESLRRHHQLQRQQHQQQHQQLLVRKQ